MDKAGQQIICGAPATLWVYGIRLEKTGKLKNIILICLFVACAKSFFISCQDHLVKLKITTPWFKHSKVVNS